MHFCQGLCVAMHVQGTFSQPFSQAFFQTVFGHRRSPKITERLAASPRSLARRYVVHPLFVMPLMFEVPNLSSPFWWGVTIGTSLVDVPCAQVRSLEQAPAFLSCRQNGRCGRGEWNDLAWIVFFLNHVHVRFHRNSLGRQISRLDSFPFC